ncbi:MAG: DNA repair protein RecO [Phycisphaerales bacterium]|nr:DNA repair protein RecO [Phycisphaerales bacterium]
MPTLQDDAVVIRRWDWSETSQTVSLFTRENGILRGLAKGAKREKGSFSGGLDLLTRGQIVAIVKPGRELATLAQWTLEETFRHLRLSLEANRAGLYFADLVHHALSQNQASPSAFDALVDALRGLAEPDDVAACMLRFQWTLLVEAGYQPIIDRDAETGRPLPEADTVAFSAEAGGVVPDTGAGDRWRVRRETVDALVTMAKATALAEFSDLDPKTLDRANRLLAAYWREVLGREPAAMRFAFSDGVLGPRPTPDRESAPPTWSD